MDLDSVQNPMTERGISYESAAASQVELLAPCFLGRSIPVSPARLVNIPVPLPAGSVNHSQDGAMQSGTSQTTGRTTPSQTWSRV